MEMDLMALINRDQVADWLLHHGMRVGVVLAVAAVAWVAVGWLTASMERRLVRNQKDESAQKLTRTVAQVTRWVVNLSILLVALVLIIGTFGVATAPLFAPVRTWILGNGVQLVFTLLIAYVALRFSGFATSRLLMLLQRGKTDPEALKRATTLSSVIGWVLCSAILIIAIIMSLGAIGVEIAPILAAAGIVGLAIGFGAQNLVQDVISGFFILLEDQIRVGDVVSLNGQGGLVERITLRTTILRDMAGSVHYVRNGKIDVVTNMTKDYSRYVFDVGVAYRESVDQVIEVLKEIDAGLRQDPDYKDDILQPIEILGLDRFADSALIIRARTTTKPIKQWRVGREFNRRLKMKFDELGIEIPFPHLTLYPGKDKKGQSPSLRVEVDGSASVPVGTTGA
jgi:moderate conductance mechanosensitive channel